MDNKLSELSNPAWIVGQQEIADFMRGDEALLVRGYDPESTEPALRMYSQEYVSALLAELEGKDKRIAELSRLLAHNIERAEKAEKRLVYSKDAIATWERKAISNFDECATMSQRIIELEAIRSDASQVFKEIGNELGCNPDNESIMTAIDELKATQMTGPLKDVLKRNIELEAKLATPVRLPTKYSMLHREDFHGDYQSKMVFKADEVIAALRAHGSTVEGDE